MMLLPAMFFRDTFCVSRKGKIGGGGWVHQSVAVTGFSFRKTWVGLGGPFLSSYDMLRNSFIGPHLWQ